MGAAVLGPAVPTVAWIEPEDIAGAVAYLASDDARYVAGLDLRVDAGRILN
ncbi:SDR family oxidoreductase [Gordonia rhizosphera]|uniref:SDR family oxidoreductase n=1 Tax=Gordonia rhizosphera TaxID=83341 RepID=UPI000A07319B